MNKPARRVHTGSALIILALVALLPGAAGAQTASAPQPATPRQIISANPFGLIFEWFNVEYHRRLTPSTTLGAGASWFGPDDEFDYASGSGIFRYYPSGTALRGFYLAGRGGVYRVSDALESDVFFGAGFEIGYDWLLGKKQNIGISLGIGATRLFGGDIEDAPVVLPVIRLLNLGIAF